MTIAQILAFGNRAARSLVINIVLQTIQLDNVMSKEAHTHTQRQISAQSKCTLGRVRSSRLSALIKQRCQTRVSVHVRIAMVLEHCVVYR